MENHSAPSAGHINREERFSPTADVLQFLMSAPIRTNLPPPSEFALPLSKKSSSVSKTKAEKKRVSDYDNLYV